MKAWIAGLLLLVGMTQAREVMDRPNVVLIYLDDSGYGDYAHHGNPVIETPNIARMAEQGMNFTQWYVTSPACSASRYSLLTGRYPARSGLGSWVIGPESKTHLRAEEVTIAEALQQRGYATGMFGKWHLGHPNEKNQMSPDTLPLAHGLRNGWARMSLMIMRMPNCSSPTRLATSPFRVTRRSEKIFLRIKNYPTR